MHCLLQNGVGLNYVFPKISNNNYQMMGHKKNKNSYSPKKPAFQEKRPADPPQEIIQEGLNFQELMSKSKENLNSGDQFGYLLSTKWYRQWKEYVGYEELIKGEDPTKSKYFGKRKPGRINTDILGKNDRYYKIPEQLPEYSYLDVVLDSDTAKEKDFIVVDSLVFTFLYEKYQGNILKRPLRKLKSGPYFDTHLHNFNVIFLTPSEVDKILDATEQQINKDYEDYIEIKRLQVSSLWGMTRLKEFLGSFLDVSFGVKRYAQELVLWKMENFLSFKEIKFDLVEALRAGDKKITARKLDVEEQNDWDIDDFIKDSCVLFVQSNGVKFQRGPLPEQITGYCQECIKVHKLIQKCPCKKVFYCSVNCRYDDKAYHFKTCGIAYDSSDDQEYLVKKIDTKTTISKCGLRNLGNTCYMNSTLQCFTNIPYIAQYFCSNTYLQHINKKEQEQNKAIFIKKFAKFVKKIFQKKDYAPWSLKMQLSYFISIFKGYQQHDANDLFVYLVNTLNEFSSKPEDSHFAMFIEKTFLGQFNSFVKCPECTMSSTTKDPFLEVSVPLKQKITVQKINFCIVTDWKSSVKGICEAKQTWDQVCEDIGVKFEESKMMIGSDRNDLKEVVGKSPSQIANKHKKDTLYFYPKTFQITEGSTYQIPLIMAYTKMLAGNEVKCYYGNPVYIFVGSAFKLSAIFQEVATTFELGAENLQLLDSLIIRSQQEYEDLKKRQDLRDEERKIVREQSKRQQSEVKRTKEEEKKWKTSQDKIKEDQRKQKQQQLADFQNKVNNEFLQNIVPFLKFKVYIRSYRKSKKACVFCHRKCNGCLLSFSVSRTVDEFLKLTDDEFKLQIVFDQIQQIKEDSISPNFNPYTTVEECLAQFSQPQQLDEENAWYCEVCDDMRLALKELKIDKYPSMLVIQLKRFKEHQGKKVKNNQIVWYPQFLGIEKDVKYQLNSVIIHQGSLEGGHYWAICRKEGKYYSFNDEKISEEKDHFSKHAYILFYEIL